MEAARPVLSLGLSLLLSQLNLLVSRDLMFPFFLLLSGLSEFVPRPVPSCPSWRLAVPVSLRTSLCLCLCLCLAGRAGPRALTGRLSPQLFEGLKAYKGGDQRVRLFRPWLNMDRMLRSALRLCLPVRGPGEEGAGRAQGLRGGGWQGWGPDTPAPSEFRQGRVAGVHPPAGGGGPGLGS